MMPPSRHNMSGGILESLVARAGRSLLMSIPRGDPNSMAHGYREGLLINTHLCAVASCLKLRRNAHCHNSIGLELVAMMPCMHCRLCLELATLSAPFCKAFHEGLGQASFVAETARETHLLLLGRGLGGGRVWGD